MVMTGAQALWLQGWIEGFVGGYQEGYRESVLKQLKNEFGELPEGIVTTVKAMSLTELHVLAHHHLRAQDLPGYSIAQDLPDLDLE